MEERKKEWLLNVIKHKLSQEELVKGYIRYYALFQKPIEVMVGDLFFHWGCHPNIAGITMDRVKKVIVDYAGG